MIYCKNLEHLDETFSKENILKENTKNTIVFKIMKILKYELIEPSELIHTLWKMREWKKR